MEELIMVVPNVINCVALMICSNLDESTKMILKSFAKNNSEDDQTDPFLEHKMRRFTAFSEQTASVIMYVED